MDPKGSAMENLLRGLGALGPTISDLVGQVGELEKKVGELSTAVVAKADKAAVDEISREIRECRNRFLHSPDWKSDLEDHVKKTESLIAQMSNEVTQMAQTQMKAYAPSLESFTEFTKEVEKMGSLQADVFSQIELMRNSLAGKIDRGVVPSVEDFDDKGILMKSNRVEVPTFDQVTLLMQSQTEEMESKTKCIQVRLGGDVDELRQAIAGKAEKDLTISSEQAQEITSDVKKIESDLLKLRSAMSDVSGVPDVLAKTVEAVEMLKAKVELKADDKSTQEQIRGINQILLPVARTVRNLPTVSSSVSAPRR